VVGQAQQPLTRRLTPLSRRLTPLSRRLPITALPPVPRGSDSAPLPAARPSHLGPQSMGGASPDHETTTTDGFALEAVEDATLVDPPSTASGTSAATGPYRPLAPEKSPTYAPSLHGELKDGPESNSEVPRPLQSPSSMLQGDRPVAPRARATGRRRRLMAARVLLALSMLLFLFSVFFLVRKLIVRAETDRRGSNGAVGTVKGPIGKGPSNAPRKPLAAVEQLAVASQRVVRPLPSLLCREMHVGHA
jgi:hypothetical protein